MNKNKLFILIAVISVLAMLIPVAAVPVFAGPAPAGALLSPATGESSHDIAGDTATFVVSGITGNQTVLSFSVTTVTGGAAAIMATNPLSTNVLPATTGNLSAPMGNGASVDVQATSVAEATVFANLSDGSQLSAIKKWGEINATGLTPPQDVVGVWNETTKTFSASAQVNDLVIGTYLKKNEQTLQYALTEEFPAHGALLDWYLVKDTPAAQAFVAANTPAGQQWAYTGKVASTPTPTTTTFSADPIFPLTVGFPSTAAHLLVNGVDVGPYTLSGGVFTLTYAMTVAPSGGQVISTLPTSAIGTATSASLYAAFVAAGLTSPSAQAAFSTFSAGGTPLNQTYTTTTSDANGNDMVTISTTGEEAILVIVIPRYPIATQYPVMLEWTKVNFWTSEMEVVPQVRWAGEKIVLEKYFGTNYAGNLVSFKLEGHGSLEGLNGTQIGNLNNSQASVWDVVSTGTDAGWARVMLVSQDPGEIKVDLALYSQKANGSTTEGQVGPVLNQHSFVVYYLKLESITLGNVQGKRANHDSGLFVPPNPWGTTQADMDNGAPNNPDDVSASLNVSQDTLLRARVRGWFMGANLSGRDALRIDASNASIQNEPAPAGSGPYTYVLPAGRWVLPDDWPILAGINWKEMRLHWDIMDSPFDAVKDPTSTIPPAVDTTNMGKGPYMNGTNLIAAASVIGPFRPGLEIATAPRYDAAGNLLGAYDPTINTAMANSYDDFLTGLFSPGPWAGVKSVVPNGALDWWDAPMPPAKITFQIQDASVVTGENDQAVRIGLPIGDAGFFKDAYKTDIYYVQSASGAISYTNPFYWEMIPASRFIPSPVNNGGYDWNSWSVAYGPYQFWKIFNRPPVDALGQWNTITRSGVGRDNANFPGKAQVYTDNHGEAMIYLNGNYNLNADLWTLKGQEPIFGSTVGSTTVVAIADYPYFRYHTQIMSNPVTKKWTWGGMVFGPTNGSDSMILAVGQYTQDLTASTPGHEAGTSKDLMVWVWATDRDGTQAKVMNTQVDWLITPSTAGVKINDLNVAGNGINGVSSFNNTMKSIGLQHGFLNNTMGVLTGSGDGTQGRSFMRGPTPAEQDLFNKFWGTGVTDGTGHHAASNPMTGVDGKPLNPLNFVVAAIDLYDPTDLTKFSPADVTVTEFLTSPDFGTLVYYTDANFSLNHPLDDDILKGDANNDGKVNVTDVTAIERMILGLAAGNIQADAATNDKINMGDVVKTERIILGLP